MTYLPGLREDRRDGPITADDLLHSFTDNRVSALAHIRLYLRATQPVRREYTRRRPHPAMVRGLR